MYKNVSRRVPDKRNLRRMTRVVVKVPYTIQRPLDIVDTKIWGAHLWRVLHILSLLATTDAAKAVWSRLPTDLDGALPCPECSQHFHEWIRANPLAVNETDAIRDWVLSLHNQVNARKQIAPWTAEQIVATYGTLTVADAIAALAPLREMIGSRGLQTLDELIRASTPA